MEGEDPHPPRALPPEAAAVGGLQAQNHKLREDEAPGKSPPSPRS